MAFDLSQVRKGKNPRPPLIMIYGVHGIGKSSFGSEAPNPIFIPTEDGLGHLDTSSFPLAKSSEDVISAIKVLLKEDHDYKTAVIDSADWLESLLVSEIEQEFDEKQRAFGKDQLLLAESWTEILDGLSRLRNERNMAVIITAHAEIKSYANPDTEPYDRYGPKLAKRSSPLVQEWADCVLFANYPTLIKKDVINGNKDKTRARGISTGERILHTTEAAAFVAKNRFSLPDQLPLSWEAFHSAMSAS